jgi:hypothetical protein
MPDPAPREALRLVPPPPPGGNRARRRVALARAIAIGADALQLIAFPLFVPGAASPWDDLIDVVVGAVMVWLLGWHPLFLPAFLAKLVPGLDLVPTWTGAVLYVTRRAGRADGH